MMQKRISYCLLSLAWLGLTLPDLYFEMQLFPILGSVCLLVMAFIALYHRTLSPVSSQTLLLLLALNFVLWSSTVWGSVVFGTVSPKGALGWSLGTLAFALILALRQHLMVLRQTLTIVACIHLLAWGYQTYSWVMTGTPPDLLASLGAHSPTRFTYGVGDLSLFRLSGLWIEPARYATFIFFVLTLRSMHAQHAFYCLDILLLVSLLGTLSLSGLGMALVFLAWRGHQSSYPLRMTFMVGIPIVLTGMGLWMLQEEAMGVYFSSRLGDLSADTSLQARTTSFLQDETPIQLLGFGIGNYALVGHTNGLLFLFDQIGWLGSIVWWIVLGLVLHCQRLTIWHWLLIAVALLGAPWWTTPLWWAWLGMLAAYTRS